MLPSSGPISLKDIAIEIRKDSGVGAISLNDPECYILAGVPYLARPLVLPNDFWGKSYKVTKEYVLRGGERTSASVVYPITLSTIGLASAQSAVPADGLGNFYWEDHGVMISARTTLCSASTYRVDTKTRYYGVGFTTDKSTSKHTGVYGTVHKSTFFSTYGILHWSATKPVPYASVKHKKYVYSYRAYIQSQVSIGYYTQTNYGVPTTWTYPDRTILIVGVPV